MAAKKPKVPEKPPVIEMLGPSAFIEGKKWINGRKAANQFGPAPARVMIVGSKPEKEDIDDSLVFSGRSGRYLLNALNRCGMRPSEMYKTFAIKYRPDGVKAAPKAGDFKTCKPMFENELCQVLPEVVVCLGATALKMLTNEELSFSTIRGEPVPFKLPDGRTVTVFALYDPAFLEHDQSAEPTYMKEMEKLGRFLNGTEEVTDVTNYRVIDTIAGLQDYVVWLFEHYDRPFLGIDAEWHGATWMHTGRYIRTVQIAHAIGEAVVINMRGPYGVPAMDNEAAAWQILKILLEDPRVDIAGHNVISDGLWLLSYGTDIRPRVVFDPMLGEYLVNELGPFGLEELVAKYTKMGHYERELFDWKDARKEYLASVKRKKPEKRTPEEQLLDFNELAGGYGPIPDAILHPYGAKDADAVLRCAQKTMPLMGPFMDPRGLKGEYPSLFDMTHITQRHIYELESTGLLVDKERLYGLIDRYQARKDELKGQLVTMAANLGYPDFNPASSEQKQDLLFRVLKLNPVKTTEGRSWADVAGNAGIDDEENEDINAATDKTTLEILLDEHPIVEMLLNFTRLDTACKNQMRYAKPGDDPSTRGGGIEGKIWPDGRLHAHFSQLSDTGRFKHSKPNVACFSKKAEGYGPKMFGCEKKDVPPMARSIIIPTPGHLIVEGDFIQAELFVLAYLSGDKNMIAALETPGKDLHDLTAISAFGLKVLDKDGNPVPEQYLLDMAKADIKAFEEYQKTLFYLDQKGNKMDRALFKSTIRVRGPLAA